MVDQTNLIGKMVMLTIVDTVHVNGVVVEEDEGKIVIMIGGRRSLFLKPIKIEIIEE